MSINVISKGIVLFYILVFSVVTFLNLNHFLMTEKTFSVVLLIGLFVISVYAGRTANHFPSINGFIVGLLAPSILLFYLSTETDMNWGLNFFLIAICVVISTIGAYIGGKIRKVEEYLFRTAKQKKEVASEQE